MKRLQYRRHPLHPMLVGLPIALWFFSLVCDVTCASNVEEIRSCGSRWATLRSWSACRRARRNHSGFIDYRSLVKPRHRELASRHLALNLVVITLYAVNLWVEARDPPEFESGSRFRARHEPARRIRMVRR
jgi:uncharacterized membrane protein